MSQTISRDAEHPTNTAWYTVLPDTPPSSNTILILAETGVAFQGLLKAAQQCFPKLDITLTNQLSDEITDQLSPRLILIQASAFRDISGAVMHFRKDFPNTPIALLVDDGWQDIAGVRNAVEERLVQGLLPFSLNINVWLATVWLLLNGGEYFPSTPRGVQFSASHAPRAHQSPSPASMLRDTQTGAKMLSAREGEVLELMSDGLQNKLIAVRMDLSEHTVKVHVHNIIRKLGVHNRTQAAAVHRSYDRRASYSSIDSRQALPRSLEGASA